MQIAVDGTRGSSSAQEVVRRIPKEQLPSLTEAQRKTAEQLGASEEAYARMILEGEQAQNELLVKAEMVARLLEKKIRELGSDATIQKVVLRARQGKFEVEVKRANEVVPLRIREELIDDLFEAGSLEAEQGLTRILRTTLGLLDRQ